MQDDVSGLQVLKDGKWITVEPLPGAFVVNIGHLLEVHLMIDLMKYISYPPMDYYVSLLFMYLFILLIFGGLQYLVVQIISKGKLKSAEHRAVTNSSHTRTSAAFFIAPLDDCLIEPAEDLTDENNQPILKSFKYKEFLKQFFNTLGDSYLLLKSFEAPKN